MSPDSPAFSLPPGTGLPRTLKRTNGITGQKRDERVIVNTLILCLLFCSVTLLKNKTRRCIVFTILTHSRPQPLHVPFVAFAQSLILLQSTGTCVTPDHHPRMRSRPFSDSTTGYPGRFQDLAIIASLVALPPVRAFPAIRTRISKYRHSFGIATAQSVVWCFKKPGRQTNRFP